MTCTHCDKPLAACLCLEEGRMTPFAAAVRLLFAPEAYGQAMDDAVAQFLGSADGPQS